MRRTKPKLDSLKQLIRAICLEYQTTEDTFHSKRRYQEAVYARFHYWHILYHDYGMNYSQIARRCGITHGAVMNGLKKLDCNFSAGARLFSARDANVKRTIIEQNQPS